MRVADNFAVMKDLPNGSERTGQAFPIVAYFDPLSAFTFSYFANLKRVDITLQRGQPADAGDSAADPSVNVVVPYNSYWAARYAPDSTDAAIHLLIDPTPRVRGGSIPPKSSKTRKRICRRTSRCASPAETTKSSSSTIP